MRNIILQGDSLTTLKALPDNYVQCVVTSPPY
jgi:DNA modification methylase